MTLGPSVCAVATTGEAFCFPEALPPPMSNTLWMDMTPHDFYGIASNGAAYWWDATVGKMKPLPGSGDKEWDTMSIDLIDGVRCLRSKTSMRCWKHEKGEPALPFAASFLSFGNEWLQGVHPCGVTTEGDLVCRANAEPQQPDNLQAESGKWVAVTACGGRRCALTTVGDVYCWGIEITQQVDFPAQTPIATLATGDKAMLYTNSRWFGAISRDDHNFMVWGIYNEDLNLRFGILQNASVIALTATHVCAITHEGRLHCDGMCYLGECDFPQGPGLRWKAVAAHFRYSCAITSPDSQLCCWGRDTHFPELRCADEGVNSLNFLQNFTSLSVGRGRVCALNGDTVMYWEAGRASAYQPEWSTEKAAQIECTGLGYDCVVTLHGTLQCLQHIGLLDYPATEQGNPGWKSISLSQSLHCGILDNGTALCSGWFPSDGRSYDLFHPHITWKQLAVTEQTICGIASNDLVFCWSDIVPPPRPHPAFAIDARYAHWAGLQIGGNEICGYLFSQRHHGCMGVSTGNLVRGNTEAFLAIGTHRGSFTPSASHAVPEGSTITLTPTVDTTQDVRYINALFSVDIIAVAATSFVFVSTDGLSARYLRISPDNPSLDALKDIRFFTLEAALILAVASDYGVCALSEDLHVWCDGSAGRDHESIGLLTTVAIANTHACGIENGSLSIVCWGDGPLPDTTTPMSSTQFQYVELSTSVGLTCAITTDFIVHCWGQDRGVVSRVLSAFAGHGWVEVELSDSLACGCHINGRLRCTYTTHSDVPQDGIENNEDFFNSVSLPVSLSTIDAIIGLAPSSKGMSSCTSTEACVTADPQSAPFHSSIVLLEDLELSSPLSGRFRFLGTRTKSLASLHRRTVRCPLSQATTSACINVLPSENIFQMFNVIVQGNVNLERGLLEVSDRPSVSLGKIVWEVNECHDLECKAEPASGSYVHVTGVNNVDIIDSHWRGPDHAGEKDTTVRPDGVPTHIGSAPTVAASLAAGLLIENAQSVILHACSFYRVTVLNGSPLLVVLNNTVLTRFLVTDSVFHNNAAVVGAGALGILSMNEPQEDNTYSAIDYSIAGCDFRKNNGFDGGAVKWLRTQAWSLSHQPCFSCSKDSVPLVAIDNCSFTANVASGSGGAIFADGILVQVSSSGFSSNTAQFVGGAIVVANGSIVSTNCSFNGNVVVPSSRLPSNNSNHDYFIEQSVEGLQAGVGGGALALSRCNLPGLVVQWSTFEENAVVVEEGDGGAISVHDCRLNITDVRMTGNAAARWGGAVYMSSVLQGSSGVDWSLVDNRAGSAGGALMLIESEVFMATSKCNNNSVEVDTAALGRIPSPYDRNGIGGCAVLAKGSNMRWADSIFASNRATQGGGIHVHCGATIDMSNVSIVPATGAAFGSALMFECPSPWLQEAHLQKSGVQLPYTQPRVLGSGPVSLGVEETIPALFEGLSEEDIPATTISLLDVNGERVTTENSTQCVIAVSVPGDSKKRPGLLELPIYAATGGLVDIMPFGVSSQGITAVGLNVTCNGLRAYTTIPIAKIVPQWSVLPPPRWVPSSGPALLPLEPFPRVHLAMSSDAEFLLQGTTVQCTVSAKHLRTRAFIALLNPPTTGYQNSENWEEVQITGLHIDLQYGEEAELLVECIREHERLETLSAVVAMEAPSIAWASKPGSTILSGVPFIMAVAMIPPDSPAANATTCTAAVSSASEAFTRGSTAVMVNGLAVWPDLLVQGRLGTIVDMSVNCSTGFHALPETLRARFALRECEPGTEPQTSMTGCTACSGTSYSPGGLERCRECPRAGATCRNGRLTLHKDFYPASSAYMRGNAHNHQSPPLMSEATILYRCDVKGSCLVSNHSALYFCAQGYEGPLCGVCSDGYAKTGLYCSECWPQWVSSAVISMAVILILLILSYIALFRKTSKPSAWKIILRITLSYIQMLSSLGQFRAKATETVQQIFGLADAVGNSVFGTGPIHCTFGLPYYGRFMLSILLPFIVGGLVVLFATGSIIMVRLLRCQHAHIQRLPLFRVLGGQDRQKTSADNANSVSGDPQPASNASAADAKAPARTVTRGDHSRYLLIKRDLWRYFHAKTFLGPILFVYFFFYNSIINTLSAVFRCRSESIDDIQYLEADMSVPCHDAAHVAAMITAGSLALLLNVLFPLALVFVLRRNRRKLNEVRVQARYGFLYMGYSIDRGLYWWEVVVLYRKFSVLMVASSISDTFFQSLVGISVIVVFFVIQTNFRPYDDALLNRLEMMVMTCLCFTQVVSLGYFRSSVDASSTASQSKVDAVVTLLLLGVNGLSMCVLVGAIVQACRKYRRSRALAQQLASSKPTNGRPSGVRHGVADWTTTTSKVASRLQRVHEASVQYSNVIAAKGRSSSIVWSNPSINPLQSRGAPTNSKGHR